MATKPKIVNTNSSVDVINAIVNSALINYDKTIPIATPDADSIRSIGNIILNNPQLSNEFVNTLANRIAYTRLVMRTYQNPLAVFKQGVLDLGDVYENIFVEIAKPRTFNPEESENLLFKREIPDVKTEFFVRNYAKMYPVTVSREQLSTAFLSWDNMDTFISGIIDSLYNAMYYDEFLVIKYMVAKRIMDGLMYPVICDSPDTESGARDLAVKIKTISNEFTNMSADYNPAGVHTFTPKENQYLLLNSLSDAQLDVNVLAMAFNMDKAKFTGHKIVTNDFSKLDLERLAILFEDDPTYIEPSAEELEALSMIPAILVDEKFFIIVDNLLTMEDVKNGRGLYWNYFLHAWKTFGTSIFCDSAVFIPDTPEVTTVTINPSAIELTVGSKTQLNANVETANFAPKSVNWSSDSDLVTVDAYGRVNVLDGASGEVTITATSTYDTEKKGTCTITIS